jgi:flavin-dependent dehydrogenase
VGVLSPRGRLGGAALRARVLEFLARRYPQSRDLPRTPYGASIPCLTARQAVHAPLGGPRFALIGDAAAQVDAITGEGIEHAFGAAAMLSEALDQADALSAAQLYTRRWRQATGRELAVAARWAGRWYRPRLVEACLAVARGSVTARRLVAELLMVVQPYSSLRSRALGDAWRRLVAGRLDTEPAA